MSKSSKAPVFVERQFPGKVTYRSVSILSKIVDKFSEYNLLERAKASPFKQFFLAPTMKFSGLLIHQILLRKIPSEDYELRFLISGQTLRFGIGEFALITGLECGKGPNKTQYAEVTNSRRLLKDYLNDEDSISSIKLENAFANCTEAEDVWKLGLCYLVDAFIFGQEPKNKIFMDMLSFVENEAFFFSYPWGRICFENTIRGLNKSPESLENLYKGQLKKKGKTAAAAQYTVYGYPLALQYWAFEAIPKIGAIICDQKQRLFPRMLSWEWKRKPSTNEIAEIFRRKNVSSLCIGCMIFI